MTLPKHHSQALLKHHAQASCSSIYSSNATYVRTHLRKNYSPLVVRLRWVSRAGGAQKIHPNGIESVTNAPYCAQHHPLHAHPLNTTIVPQRSNERPKTPITEPAAGQL